MRRAICGKCLEDCLIEPEWVGEPEMGVYREASCPRCGAKPIYQYDDPPTGRKDGGSTDYRQQRIPGTVQELG